jgi:hypothetical protein
MPIVADTKLYERVKAMADQKYAKPSAYKSGYIVKTYKQLGGEYIEDGKPKNLKRWYKERWSDVGGLDYPVLRPTVKVSKKTPLLPSEISNLPEQIKLKQKIKGKNLPPFISRDISMKGGARFINIRRLNHVMPGLRLTDMEKQMLVDEINIIRDHRDIKSSRTTIILPTIFSAATSGAVTQNIHDEVMRNFREMIDDGMTDTEGAGMYGGMMKLPTDVLHEISGYQRKPRTQIIQTRFPENLRLVRGYVPNSLALEHGVHETSTRTGRLYTEFGSMYPGGLAAAGSITAYNNFITRLQEQGITEEDLASRPKAERRQYIRSFLRSQRCSELTGMCVASGKPKRVSKWVEHVKAHAKKYGVSYKQAMQDSRRTYVG